MNVLSANGLSYEANLLLDAIHESLSTENEVSSQASYLSSYGCPDCFAKWRSVLLVGYGLGGIIIKQVRDYPESTGEGDIMTRSIIPGSGIGEF
jgi:hypothetical protein